MSVGTYCRLLRLFIVLLITAQLVASNGCTSTTTNMPMREVHVSIEMISPIRGLTHDGLPMQFATLRDARVLAGVEGMVDGGPAHALLITVYNPTDETLLLSSWDFDQMFVHHMIMRDGPWEVWKFFSTWEHVELGAPVFLVPIPAHHKKRWVYTLPCTRLGTDGSHQSQAMHLPESLTYEFKDGATIKARPLQMARLAEPVDIRVVGRGKATLSPDGLYPWSGHEPESVSTAKSNE